MDDVNCQLQLHHNGTLDSADHWHCRALPLGFLSTTVVMQFQLHTDGDTHRLLVGRDSTEKKNAYDLHHRTPCAMEAPTKLWESGMAPVTKEKRAACLQSSAENAKGYSPRCSATDEKGHRHTQIHCCLPEKHNI